MKFLFYLSLILIIILLFFFIFFKNRENFIPDIYSLHLKPKKFIIITLENRNLSLNHYHNQVFKDYALKYNYQYIFLNHYESKLPIYWCKFQLLLDYLNNKSLDFDYIVWADSDIMICIDKPLEFIIYPSSDYDLIMSLDYIDKKKNDRLIYYNAGFFILKNSDISRQFLNDCLNYYQQNMYCKDKKNNLILKGMWAGICYEQGVMNVYLNSNIYKKYCYSIPKDQVLNHNKFNENVIFMHYHDRFKKDKISSIFSTFLKFQKKNFINIFFKNSNLNFKNIYFWNILKKFNLKNYHSFIFILFKSFNKNILIHLPFNFNYYAIHSLTQNFIGISLHHFNTYYYGQEIEFEDLYNYTKHNLPLLYFY